MMIYSIGILILRRTVQIQFPSGYSTEILLVMLVPTHRLQQPIPGQIEGSALGSQKAAQVSSTVWRR